MQERIRTMRLAGRPTIWGDPFRRANSFWGGILLGGCITFYNLHKFHRPFAWTDWAMVIPLALFIFGYNNRG
jgi:hypothetical protein